MRYILVRTRIIQFYKFLTTFWTSFFYDVLLTTITNMENFSPAKGVSTEEKSIWYDNYEIYYYCSGSNDKRPIVLIHPAYCDHTFFDPILKFLTHEYYVIRLDLIGHGQSIRGKSKDQIDISADHIRKILREEQTIEAHIVGVSTGALVAQSFTQKYPFMSTSLTVAGGFDINNPNPDVKKVRKYANSGVLSQTLFSMDTFRRKKANHSCDTRSGRALYFKSTASFKKKNLPVLRGVQKIVQEREVPETIATLILVGEYDIEPYKSLAAEWYSYTEYTEFEVIEGAGHCIPLDRPLTFSSRLIKFIKQEENSSILA